MIGGMAESRQQRRARERAERKQERAAATGHRSVAGIETDGIFDGLDLSAAFAEQGEDVPLLVRIELDEQREVHIRGQRNAGPLMDLPHADVQARKEQGPEAFTAWLDELGVVYTVTARTQP